eukprot:gene15904-17504_t
MVSAAASSAANAQLFRQAEGLKANISGKFLETTDYFSDEYVTCKNLQNIYKTILLSDLQYALDRKVELELWNNAFKGHIDYLRQRLKEKRGSEKAELQAKLWLFIDTSMGFYLKLLEEFCDRNDIESPFGSKSTDLGISSARYKNDINQAETYYKKASTIVAVNGQPYNQLAIIASSKGEHLKAIFYYCKSVLVQNPFPAAVSNLQKTLNQFCSRQSLSILSKTTCSSVEEFISLFLQYHGSVYLMHNIDKLSSMQDRILADFKVIQDEFNANQLLYLTVLNIFTIYKNKPKEDDEQDDCFANEEIEVSNLVMEFSLLFYRCIVTLAASYCGSEDEADSDRFLPSIKVFSDYILCTGSAMLLEKCLYYDVEFFRNLSILGNELLKRSGPVLTPSALPLPEDHEVNGFFPLRRIHRKLDFKQNEISDDIASSLRAYRIISFINWLCHQEPATRYIGKGKRKGKVGFICLQPEAEKDEVSVLQDRRMSDKDFDNALRKLFDTLPELQLKKEQPSRSKSPFRETRSLFRTDSEEQGIKDVPQVSGPVASYSLFDSTWSAPLKASPAKDKGQEEQGYPEIFQKLIDSVQKGSVTAAQSATDEQPNPTTQTALFPKASRALNLGVFPSSGSVNRPQRPQPTHHPLSPMANQIPNHPIQQQLSRLPHNVAAPQPSPSSFFANQPSFPIAQNHQAMHLPPTRMDASINLNGLTTANQQPLPFANQPQAPSFSVPANVAPQAPALPGFVPNLVSNGAVFGAIGQTPRSHFLNSPQMNMSTPPGSPTMTRNGNKSNQSIWSSNYGFGQGAMSPLEQLLSDQKKTQRHPMQPPK